MKAIFWDNDGVLVDTEHLYFEATRHALRELGHELSESEFVELSLRQGGSCFDLAAARGVPDARIEAARLARNDRYAESLAHTELIPGVHATLESLHGRVPMAVVTSSRPEHFSLQHRATGALRFFEFVLTGADFTRFKPDPQPYLLAAARLGVAPEECLVIEDSERGLVAATRAGMRCAVVPRGFTKSGDFSSAYRVLDGVDQVPELLAELVASSARRDS
jgi:HAD superfamily hydrolase (TIGR01509 family)